MQKSMRFLWDGFQPGVRIYEFRVQLSLEEAVRQSPADKNMSMAAENIGEDTTDWEDLVHAAMNWRVCELVKRYSHLKLWSVTVQ
jgi:hypothetical protein